MEQKAKQLYDLHEMYWSGVLTTWISTPLTNVPFTIARHRKRVLELDKKYPKGTFFKIVKNGIKPI